MDSRQALDLARQIAASGGDEPSTLRPVDSRSSTVFIGASTVIKISDAGEPDRFAREVALAADLPAGLSAPVLDQGRWLTQEHGTVQYVRLARLPGTSPGMGLPGADRPTAVRWARQATAVLQRLHDWEPSATSAAVLSEPLDHGGFTTRERLRESIDAAHLLDNKALIPRAVIDGLNDIADDAPERAITLVPVHADCHWENWLIDGGDVTALLDFEWARFGEPADDWMFLARFSGPHRLAVLQVIAECADGSLDELRTACEVREASYLVSDLLLALQNPRDPDQREAQSLLPDLVELSTERAWQQGLV